MKRRIIALLTALLMALSFAAALAEVRTNASVWLRTGPGLSYDTITSLSEGKKLTYLGDTKVDERGVAWYKVSFNGTNGWVSSKYTELVGESGSTAAKATAKPTAKPTPKPTAKPTPEPTAKPAATESASVSLPALGVGLLFGDSASDDSEDAAPTQAPTQAPVSLPLPTVELSTYYQHDLVDAANALSLISYRQVESEAPYQYYNNALILAGNQYVENIVVYGEGYEVYGVSVGMTASAARACLNAAGLDYVPSMEGLTYEHRAAEGTPFYKDANGHDSCINLWLDANDTVTEIDWSTYTG